MSELKTKATKASVNKFLEGISPENRKKDGLRLLEIFQEETEEKAVLWGPSIIGFGSYKYIYTSGKEMDWFPVGYSPRKASLSIYLMRSHKDLETSLSQLGKHKLGKGCLYINKLADIDEKVLRSMIRETYLQLSKPGQ